MARAAQYLDEAVPLEGASHTEVTSYAIGADADGQRQLRAILDNGGNTGLVDPSQFVGFVNEDAPSSILLVHNGLHLDIQIDASHPVGAVHPAGVKDVVLESAVTTIQDCEDSVAAVDAEDKCVVYGNWLGLMKGDLQEVLEKTAARSCAGSIRIANTSTHRASLCRCMVAVSCWCEMSAT